MTREAFGHHRILFNTAETLSMQFYADGVVDDPGTTTIGILDEAGTVVVAAGTATSGTGTAARTYALAAQTQTRILTVTWTTTSLGTHTQLVEVVGGHLFTLAQARDFDNRALASTSDYPQARIEETRSRITDAFESICGVAFVPRYARVTLDGPGIGTLYLPDIRVRSLRQVEEREKGARTFTAVTATELDEMFADERGRVFWEYGRFTAGVQNWRVAYEHGHRAPPLEITRAALRLLVSFLGAVRTDWDPRMTSLSSEAGFIQLATPGLRGSLFGLPEVDAVLNDPRYNERRPGVA